MDSSTKDLTSSARFESPILSQEPGARSQEPGARSQEPGARSQEPGARSQEPGARSQEPGARSQEPGARSQEPGARSQEPGARSQEPGARSQEPGAELCPRRGAPPEISPPAPGGHRHEPSVAPAAKRSAALPPSRSASTLRAASRAASVPSASAFRATCRAVFVACLCLGLPLQAQAQTTVPDDWELIPSGLSAGDSFRLLFLSSTKRKSGSGTISVYNTFIEDRAANGHTAIQAYSSGFKAVGSTASVDARDNTASTYTNVDKGVPIYWLNGNKVADDYEDFYDGSWDAEANDKNESGTNGPNTAQTGNHPATGSDHDGTEAFNTSNVSRALGATIVRVGRPNNSTTGYGPLSSTNSAQATANRPFYGLSEVFTVADTTPPALESAGVPAAGGRINLTFDENLERVNEFDTPDEAAFTVKADGVEVVVTNTNTNPTAFRDVIISLSGSIKQGQTVTVSYDKDDAGTQPIRDAAGNETLTFTDQPVTNNSTVSPSTVPGPPTGLTATRNGATRIDLAWTAPIDNGGAAITGYLIEVSADAGSSWSNHVDDTGSTDTTYQHTGLSPGTTRDYRVSAINSAGTGNSSNEDSATTVGAPGPPTNVQAAPGTTSGSVRLSWGPPASDGGAAIDRYQYRYKTTGNYPATWTTVNGGGSARSVTVSSLTNGMLHTFQVRARNGAGDGTASEATATPTGTTTTTAPGALGSLDASAGDRRVTLIWSAPSSDGGAAISRYEYRYKTTGNYGPWSTVSGGGSARSVTVSRLANGTLHTFQVRARNSVGPGPETEETAAPTAGNAAPTFTEGATASRNVEENASSGTAVGNPLTATATDSGDSLTYTLEGTDAQFFTVDSDSGQIRTRSGVTYDHEAKDRYSVTVRVSDGTASVTIDVTINVDDVNEPPRAPKLPRVTKTDGGTSLLVAWTAPPNTGRPDITGYDLRYREQGSSGPWTNGPQNVSGTSTTITNLNADTEYEVQVRARNAEGDGDWSTEDITPPPPPPAVGPPSPPRGLTATAGDRAVQLSWRRPAEDGGARIGRYEYRQREGDGAFGAWQIIGEDPPPTDHTVTGLMNGVSYTFEVRAVNSRHASPPSETASATPEPEREPFEVDIVGVPDVAVAGESYELTAQSDAEEALVYAWRVAYGEGGSVEPTDTQTVVWTAPSGVNVAWIRVDATRAEDGATAGQSAYVRVEVPEPEPEPEPEPVPALPLLGQLLLALGLTAAGARLLSRRPRVPPAA